MKNTVGSGGFINPKAVISQLQIKPGARVADLGCGHGYFTIPLAKMVGETGRVWAVDVLPAALAEVENRALAENLKNIETVRGNLEKEGGAPIGNAECDFVILANTLYQSQQKEAILKEALRILRIQGRLVVIDWRADDLTIGPREGWRLGAVELKELAKKQGALFLQNLPTGNFHYGLIFVK